MGGRRLELEDQDGDEHREHAVGKLPHTVGTGLSRSHHILPPRSDLTPRPLWWPTPEGSRDIRIEDIPGGAPGW